METKELTETELLVRINTLKRQHELLKGDILNIIADLETKEQELAAIELEYAQHVEKLIK